MGVGKGKKGRKEDKKATKKAAEKAKIPKIPKPPRELNPAKIAKKAAIRERREERKINPIGCDPVAFPTPMGRLKPFTHQHAKWPALMKKHIGVLESHVKSLDRIMMSMRSDFQKMPDTEEKLDYELGERGNWRAICSMMDRAREILGQAKEGAYGVLPAERMRDKKGLGLTGTSFVPLVPQLDKKAAELGYDPKSKGKLGREFEAIYDKDGDQEMSDATDSSSDSDSDSDSDSSSSSSDSENEGDNVADGADFVSLGPKKTKSSKKAKVAGESSGEDKENKTSANGAENTTAPEPSNLFFVDTEPTPVNLEAVKDAGISNKAKKRAKKEALAAERAEKKARRALWKEDRIAKALRDPDEPEVKSAPAAEPDPAAEPEKSTPEPDFNALAAKLQEEIATKTKVQEEEEAEAAAKAAKKEKKRRRSSDGDVEVVEKKAKKEKSEKKEKKRKADDGTSVVTGEIESGKKKKRKQEADA